MKNIEIVKEVGQIAVGIGVGNIVGCIIRTNVPMASFGTIKKVCTCLGTIVLSNMVNEKANKFYEEKFDKTVDFIKVMVNEEDKSEE